MGLKGRRVFPASRGRDRTTGTSLRRTALAVAAVLAAEAALVSLSSGQAFAAADSGTAKVTSTAAKSAKSAASTADSTAAALLMARLQGRKIEVLSERSASSTTYALPNGQLQTSTYAAPIRQKVDGTWRDIDTSLSDAGASLEPDVAAADIAVSDGGDTALASVTKGARSFGMGWESKLPTPSVKDDTASYALRDGERLTVTALSQGFSQNVILDKAPTGPLEYRIPMRLKGLELSVAESGHLLLKDKAGKLVAEAPAPMMWDSSKDRRSGESKHQARVATKVETAEDGAQTLVLTPDAGYFTKNKLTYPVTVDPTSTLAVTTDTWVATNYTDSQVSSEELKSGSYDAGTTKARSYMKFDVAPFKGKHITDTNLALYSYYSSTCDTTGAGTEVRRITGTWTSADITWAAQPATTATGAATNKAALGYSTSCPAGTVNFDIDAIVQAWADGATNQGVRIAGASETDSTTWRRYRSANYVSGDGSTEPHLTVTYNSYPAVPSSTAVAPSQVNAYNGKRYVTSLTPTISSKVTDPDGSNSQAQYEITADPAYADTTYAYTAYGKTVASGSTSTLAIPTASAFPAGSHLRYRARAYDGTDFGSWSGYTTFVLNTAKPAAPTVTCDTYTQNGWTAKASAAVNCTLATAATDGAGFQWGLDDASLPNKKLDTTNGTGGDTQTVSINPANGWHTLYARTIDSGGNLSTATTAYSFGVGADGAAILSPLDGDTTARRLTLAAKGLTTYTGVTWQYRRGETDTWHTVPVGDVTAAGAAVSAWPVAVTSGTATKLVWNTVNSLSEDGVIQLRAAFTNGTTTGYSQTTDVTLDRDAGTAPTAQVGPGEVNELTGDYTLSATDASAFSASVGRTYSSRANDTDIEGQAQVFGPGWTPSVGAEGSGFTQLRKTSGTSVELLSADGSAIAFTATSGGGWKPQTGAESLTLTGSLSGSAFTLTDTSANVTVFAKAADASPTWTLSSSATAVDDSKVVTVSEPVTVNGKTLARPKYVISPTSAVTAATCQATPATKGCRVLEYVYATATTATAGALGNYAGQVASVNLWATTPDASASTAETIASYAYNASGQLRQVWDPRISPAVKMQYTYDSDGRIQTLTEPGELPWTLAYGKAGSALTSGTGMLLNASRPALAQGSASTTSGTAATTVVYDVPLTGAKAPHAMDTTAVATWAQDVAPTDATAIFPADSVPASSTGNDLTADQYARATITYIGVGGEETNIAGPGGAITTAEHDEYGNVVSELTAANRELALGGADALTSQGLSGLSDLSTAERAEQLATTSTYSADGQHLTDEYGPLHQVALAKELTGSTSESTLAAGTVVPAREHTTYAYDENRPSDAAVSDLVTSTVTGASITGYGSDADTVTSTTTYDWSTGRTKATAGGDTTSTVTTYDDAGRVATTRPAGATGSDAATLNYTYYTADGSGTCGARREWAGMLCRTAPAASITGGGSNPTEAVTTVYTYDRRGNMVQTVETANSVTRTVSRTSDTAGRIVAGSVSGGLGTSVGTSTVTYDPASGRIATQSANGQTIAYTFDALGRQISYADGAGNTRTTAYDILDRVVKTTDSAPSNVSYTYDAAGNTKTLTDSVAGTFTGTYDADGTLTAETLPGNYKLAITTDPSGDVTTREYTDSANNTVLSDSADTTVHGRQVTHAQTAGGTIRTETSYDTLGRLVTAGDQSATGCTTRSYAFDASSNRTSLTSSSDDCDSSTDDRTSQTSSYVYDSASRLIADGTSYDAFGRTTVTGTTSLSYYNNDLVRAETVGTERKTWSLDAASRTAVATDASRTTDGTWTDGTVTTNHYGDASDNPAWIKRSDGTVRRYVSDPLGQLAAVTTANGGTTLQMLNLHGDVSVTLALDTAAATVSHYDEYGKSAGASAQSSAYGWLGGMQRSADTVSGMTLMGVRLYSSETGRFLSTDPVTGGSCSGYDYACADPVNKSDLSGAMTAGCKTFNKSYKVYEGGVKIQIATIAMHVQVCVRSNGTIKSSRGSSEDDMNGAASVLGWSLNLNSPYESSSGGFYTNWRANGKGQVCLAKITPVCGFQERFKMTMHYGVKYGPVGGWFKPSWGAKCTNSNCGFRFK
ncbi:DNRLRE domain-containing protein [Streptomyces turgidiscabies]|uniref:RHS repeat-associated core domain protein n=1 Tax=Streptomyces turgidiscabies (strain Car8) TaxID=698760 RepID=L7EXJ2_STRT8|nr:MULTISPECIES: DNRLRE domain-containing protein [Streptomyces]ELP63431.1 RHS repeat-associated core domain protein [Streptomyces turgidiscabies Car8]MDX3497842.1 DNRLRE domain-containing protein [Streptomyces turgidiscabies]GAQ69745.1 tRNA nuclease WapA precursor [Streptomyces turgidiscabies]